MRFDTVQTTTVLQGDDLTGALDWCECAGSDLTGAILDEADMPGAKATEEQLQTVVSGKSVKREA